MRNRKAQVKRKTKETNISLELNLDKNTPTRIQTPINFLNHMLELFAKHGQFGISLKASGDVQVDDHHLVEDIGLVLGQAFYQALGNKGGIQRYGFFILPMDESLASVAVDFSGRVSFNFSCQFNREKIGDLSSELIYDFWESFTQNAKMNLHIKLEYGRNDHHKSEAIFKCCARAIKQACSLDPNAGNEIPSTKGSLE